jgi:uncharacterized protein (DUF1499 family)
MPERQISPAGDFPNSWFDMQVNPNARPVLAVTLLLAGCTGPPDKPLTMEALPECGWLPNCVNSSTGRGVHATAPIRANAEQWKRLKAWIARQEDWEITVNDQRFLQAVVKTPLMRFRDDVQLLFFPEDQLIQVRSSSRLGFGDMGTNAKRVEALRELLAP